MTVTVTCTRCGHERQVPSDEIRRGCWQDRCPVCPLDEAEDVAMMDSSALGLERLSVPPGDSEGRLNA